MSGPQLEVLLPAVALVSAFLLGSIPFGVLMARVFKAGDLTQKGSGNIGATNVSRVLGFWPAGFITLLLDSLKGAAAVALTRPEGAQLWLGLFDAPQYAFALTTV